MSDLELKNQAEDRKAVADFNLSIFEMLCHIAKDLCVEYALEVSKISDKVHVYGYPEEVIVENEFAKGAK